MPQRSLTRYLVRHECRSLIMQPASWCIATLLAVAVGYALFSGWQWRAFQERTLEAARAEQQRRYSALKQDIVDIDERRKTAPFADPRLPEMVGSRLAWSYATMPPLTLSTFSIGQSDILPSLFRVSTAAKDTVLSASEIENPHRLLRGRFDLSFVIVFLLPLLIIALSYNVVSLEKEEGTLSLVLSQPVALRTLLLVKVAVRALALSVLLVALTLLTVAIGSHAMSSAEVVRVALWGGIVLAYAAFWFGLTLLVTSVGWGSATNALALSSAWLFLVVVFPALLNISVQAWHPMPSRVELIEASRVATDEANRTGNALLARYYGDHPELVAGTDLSKAMVDIAITRLAIDEAVERGVRPVVERYHAQLLLQQRIVDRLRFVSPAILAQDALNDVAGTGAPRYRHFVEQVASYHDMWRHRISSLVLQKARFTPTMYDDLPQFDYQNESTVAMVGRVLVGVTTLIVVAGCLSMVGIGRLTRYPVIG